MSQFNTEQIFVQSLCSALLELSSCSLFSVPC